MSADGKVEVRVTMFPDKPIRVDPAEARVLRSQGLLVDDEPEDAAGDAGDPPDGSTREPAPAASRAARAKARTATPSSGTE